MMKPLARRLAVARRRHAIAMIGVALAIGACSDVTSRPLAAPTPAQRPAMDRRALERSCNRALGLEARQVESGAAADLNANGVVCDRNDGSVLRPLIVTLDDVASDGR